MLTVRLLNMVEGMCIECSRGGGEDVVIKRVGQK
jgi:hypothetical protein